MAKDPLKEYFELLPDRIDEAFKAVDAKGNKDELGRAESAHFLTRLLVGRYNNNKDSFVFNINAEWGFGKTFLVERWSQALKKAGHPVTFYNAWENDFTDQPLLSFISHIEDALVPPGTNKAVKGAFEDVKSTAFSVVKSLPSILGKAVLSWALREGATELIEIFKSEGGGDKGDGVNGGKKGLPEYSSISSPQVDSILKHHSLAKKSIEKFRLKLKKFVETLEKDGKKTAPLFIFVDELDRCKPDYAIRLLEVIKHLFEVDGVYFIISTDTDALAKACQAVYGPNYDGKKYLKRFFQQTYKLPEPSTVDYIKFLFKKHDLGSFDKYDILYDLSERQDEEKVIELIVACSVMFNSGLRDVEQVVMLTKSLVDTWQFDKMHVGYLVPLIFTKVMGLKRLDRIEKVINNTSPKPWYNQLSEDDKIDVNTSIRYDDTSVPVFKLVDIYMRACSLTHAKLFEQAPQENGITRRIYSSLHTENPNGYARDSNPNIIHYHELVEQAGHLVEW